MPIQLIALDLDGTLLDQQAKVSPRNLAILLAAQSTGITIVIATGRRHFYALRVLRQLPLDPETLLISSNGAIVRTFASTLLERTVMDPTAARWLLTRIPDRRSLVLTFDRTGPDGEDTRGSLVVENFLHLQQTLGKWIDANEPYILEVDPLDLCLQDDLDPPIQMMLCGPIQAMRTAEISLLEDPQVAPVGSESRPHTTIQLNRTDYPARDLSILDILPAGCSKGAAILRIAAARNIPPADIMCLGDNWNDLSMLEIAGHPVLMGNAPEDLQSIARTRQWHITLPHDQDGVAEAIEQACPQLLLTNVQP